MWNEQNPITSIVERSNLIFIVMMLQFKVVSIEEIAPSSGENNLRHHNKNCYRAWISMREKKIKFAEKRM